MLSDLGEYAVVALIGLAVGVGELIHRYRDEPVKVLGAPAAVIYVLVNVGAALLALYFARMFGWTNVDGASADQTAITRVIVAGFGAMALFRSAVFNARIGDKDVGIGPAALLQIFLDASDRGVDRARAAPRAAVAARIMGSIDFMKAQAALPVFCFEIMQNVSAEDQKSFGHKIASLSASSIPPVVKSMILGLSLLNLVGETVLQHAVEKLHDQIKT